MINLSMIKMVNGRALALGAGLTAALLGLVSCSDDSKPAATATSTLATSTPAPGVTMAGISAERCAANKAAGTITFLTGFDEAASASIVDVQVAKEKGYFAKMCLDVQIKPSFSTQNYALVASGKAQFASGGSFAEVVKNSTNGAELQAVEILGNTAVEALVIPDRAGVTTLADLKGKTIGVKGDLAPAIVAMLNRAGLQRGRDYKERPLSGFDPRAHLDTGIDALPVFQSNEPGVLTAAGGNYAKFKLFKASDNNTPGSFGMIFTSNEFAAKHRSVVEDFVRADLKGFADAVGDPVAATAISVKRIQAIPGNTLTAAGETYRWKVEAKLIADTQPKGLPFGVIDPTALQAQLNAYTAAGVFTTSPALTGRFDETVARSAYDSTGVLIWPAN